jgi:6-pyruvoyltetrahydropterin/6-carboxytetrahydropterin synthase
MRGTNVYQVTKTYDHNLGLSACFRQHKAESHCRFLHGYALSFKLTFSAIKLNENNWVIDFGGLKPIKAWLCDNFDHKLISAEDDPYIQHLKALEGTCEPGDMDYAPPLAQVLVLPFVGCEGFAKYVFDHVDEWLGEEHFMECDIRGLQIESVEVREHGGNSALYLRNA